MDAVTIRTNSAGKPEIIGAPQTAEFSLPVAETLRPNISVSSGHVYVAAENGTVVYRITHQTETTATGDLVYSEFTKDDPR